MRVPSIKTLEEFQLQVAAASGADKKEQRDIIEGAAKSKGGSGLLDFVQRTASNTYASSRRLQEIGKNYKPKATYPNTPLGRPAQTRRSAHRRRPGCPRCSTSRIGNFDTHSTQAPAHANLLTQLSEARDRLFQGRGRARPSRIACW